MNAETVEAGGQGSLRAAPVRILGDEALLRLAARGNESAFAAIFDRHHQSLFGFALTIVGNREDAYDAVQNATVKLLDSLPGERREIKLKPWLFRIVHNEAVSILRRRAPVGEAGLERVATDDGIEDRVRAHAIIADLSTLIPQQRAAVAMRELNGLSHGEIGTALGISEAAAKQSVFEGRVALREVEQGREMSCASIEETLSANDRRLIKGRRVRAHLRSCAQCRAFESSIATRRTELAALAPLPLALSGQMLAGIVGGGGGPAGGAGVGLAAGSIGMGTLAKVGASVAIIAGAGIGLEKASEAPAAREGGTEVAVPAPWIDSHAVATERVVNPSGGEADEGGNGREVRVARGTGGGSGSSTGTSAEAPGRGGAGAEGGGSGSSAGGGDFSPGGGSIAPGEGGGAAVGGGGGSSAGGGGSGSPNEGDGGPPSEGGGGNAVEPGVPIEGGGGEPAGGPAPAPVPDPVPETPPVSPTPTKQPQGQGPAHGQAIAGSHQPVDPGNSAGHAQNPVDPPGLGNPKNPHASPRIDPRADRVRAGGLAAR